MKVTIIGAGNVGATCAQFLYQQQKVREIILIDKNPDVAEGKVIDILQAGIFVGNTTKLSGYTDVYDASENSDVIVVTAGVPRKKGMSREELVSVNTSVVTDVVGKCLKFSPKAKIIVLTNPVDSMTYLILKEFNLPRNQVIGMGGILDTARFKYYIQEKLQKSSDQIQAFVIGGHGDKTMLPLARLATYGGVSIVQFLTKVEIDDIVEKTMKGGATLTAMLGTSAWLAPAQALCELILAILYDKKVFFSCSVLLEGEYDEKDVCIGVPCLIGKEGMEQIIELPLIDQEKSQFSQSVSAIKSVNLEMLNL